MELVADSLFSFLLRLAFLSMFVDSTYNVLSDTIV